VHYAIAQNNLGNAYRGFPTGDRAANLQRAIECYTKALRFLTPETEPLEYATTQTSLGNAYRVLPTGDRTANLERAIECYMQALRYWTAESAPLGYATTQNSLGLAYAGLPTGDRAANLERAIECYMQALRYWTAKAAPLEYAGTQNNLGNAYGDLPTGDRAANLERAIECYTQALRFRTPEATPRDYGTTQNNLGNAYRDLPTGDRAANLERAIECYMQALRFLTPEAAPLDYARTQNNLGNAYRELPTGDRSASLERAIGCYTQALRFRTPEAAPRDYAATQNGLGNAYAALPTGDRLANLERAIGCYTQALRFWTPEASPDEHRATAGNLARLHFRERNWEAAHDAFESALKASELRYQATATEHGRQAELAQTRNLVPNDAYCLAQLGRFRAAVERLEAGRGRALAETLARDRAALGHASAADRDAFEAVRARIKVLEAEGRRLTEHVSEGKARPFAELSAEFAAARQELGHLVERIREYVPDFMPGGLAYEEIAAAATPSRALVYLITTTAGSLALIVSSEPPSEPDVVWLDRFGSAELDALLLERDASGVVVSGYLLGQIAGDEDVLDAALEKVLPMLQDHLVGPLALRLNQRGIQEATLVAGGLLSLLPLPAAAPKGFIVAVAPSARILRVAGDAAARTAELTQVLLAVGNPLPLPRDMQPLAYAAAEAKAIAPLFGPGSHILVGENATRERLVSNLEGTTHLHLACHGSFDPDEPLDSGLWLSAGERLTLRVLMDGDLDLSSSRLAVLSSCQSGVIEFEHVPDEVVGLPAGFLQAGVPGVVSTLWPVNDISTAVLVVEFYRLLVADRLDPANALSRATEFLRGSTAEQIGLARWFEREFDASGSTDQDAFEAAVHYRANPEERPFNHSRYWAGFVFSGN
jgi:CHAT domain-containing protein/tetratricopeptide (TPR) repeat protein